MSLPAFPLAFLSLILEAVIGYSPRLVRLIGHPVTWFGHLIARLDARLNRPQDSADRRRRAGVRGLALLLAAAILPALILQLGLGLMPFGIMVTALLGSTFIAQRSLHAHVAEVARALDLEGIAAARRAVSQIVGRDPESLDRAGVAGAAIESLAENFSDGIVSPILWMGVAGLPGAAAFKAVSTADSMIGHRTPRHLDYGRASARLDDLMNLPGARLCGLLLVIAAFLVPGANGPGAFQAMLRDARKHRSPNAGWPEAAMAGALGIALGGPRVYAGVVTEAAFMGGGRRDLTARDIRRALFLYRVADGLLMALLAALAVLQLVLMGT